MNASWYQLLLCHKLAVFQDLGKTTILPSGYYLFKQPESNALKRSGLSDIFSECVESLSSSRPQLRKESTSELLQEAQV